MSGLSSAITKKIGGLNFIFVILSSVFVVIIDVEAFVCGETVAITKN